MAKVKGSGILGLTVVGGCWLAQVQVDGVRHRRTFGKATAPNAVKAVAWLDSKRAARTSITPDALAAMQADSVARIEAYATKQAKHVLTLTERMALERKRTASKKKR